MNVARRDCSPTRAESRKFEGRTSSGLQANICCLVGAACCGAH